MKCPVCAREHPSMLCPRCGFDSSRDYMRHPTFAPIGKTPSASAQRKQWLDKQISAEQKEPPRKKSAQITAPAPAQRHQRKPAKKPWKNLFWLGYAVSVIAAVAVILICSRFFSNAPTDPPAPWESNILCSDEIADNGRYFNEAQAYPVFGSDYSRGQIKSVTFLDTLADAPRDAWDVSEAGNNTVLAWVEPTGALYNLYIGAEGGVTAGASCRCLFAGYSNATNIRFGYAFHTNTAEDMSYMFRGCGTLKELNLLSFDTASVQDMSCMFLGCDSLKDLILSSSFVTTNANTTAMFLYCPAGSDLDHLLK